VSVTDGSRGFVGSSGPWRHGIAVLSVAALAIQLALDVLAASLQVLFAFTLAVMAAARIGGRGPRLLFSGLRVPLPWYFLIQPRYSFAVVNPVDVGKLVVLSGALIERDKRNAAGAYLAKPFSPEILAVKGREVGLAVYGRHGPDRRWRAVRRQNDWPGCLTADGPEEQGKLEYLEL
jgi:hypothetical protein